MQKKVKNVLISLDIEGRGIVNNDSTEQKWVFLKEKGESSHHLFSKDNNVSYSKKNFYYDENGKLLYKIKISEGCMKKTIFNEDMITQTPNIAHHDALLYSFIASPMSLVRGYMFANKTDTLKRSGALTLTDAEQTSSNLSYLETFTKSGPKTDDSKGKDEKETSFFKKETVGEIKYTAKGDIDVMALQFVSCDPIFDRYSFNPDKYELFSNFINKRIPNYDGKLGFYKQKTSFIEIPEEGILLSNENVVFLVKDALKKILKMNIKRSSAYAKVETLRIKLVTDTLTDTFSNENGWITLKTESDIDNLNFDVEDFYEELDLEKAKALRESLIESAKAIKEKADKDREESIILKREEKEKQKLLKANKSE